MYEQYLEILNIKEVYKKIKLLRLVYQSRLRLGLIAQLSFGATLLFSGLFNSGLASAAACTITPDPTKDTDKISINVTSAGTYRVWSNILAPDTANDSYFLQVDGNQADGITPVNGSCGASITVGGNQSIAGKGWTWVNYYMNGNTASFIDLSLASGTHTVIMTGNGSGGLGLDRLLFLTDTSCTPTETGTTSGNNCTPASVSPTVSITSPASGNTVSGNSVKVSANAAETGGSIASIQFYDGTTAIGSPVTTPTSGTTYDTTWNTTSTANGSHSLTAKATDTTGVSTTSSPVSVTVNNIAPKPTVSITAPTSGATVSGTTTVSATASETGGSIASVQFKDGTTNLGSPITTAPYNYSWGTKSAANGTHSLTAVATDTTGISTTSSPVSVTVNNVSAFSCAGSTATICEDFNASASNFTVPNSNGTWNVSGGQYVLTNPAIPADPNLFLNDKSLQNTDLSGDFTMTYDGSTNKTGSTFVNFGSVFDYHDEGNYYYVVFNQTDDAYTNGIFKVVNGVQQPRLAGFPTTGTITSNTMYNIKIVKTGSNITVFRGGVQQATVSDTTFTDGKIGLGSRGNAATFDNLVVNGTKKDTIFPTVSITAPANGDTVTGTIPVDATASDNVGVTGVQFKVDGVTNIGSVDTTAPYSVNWDTTTVSCGIHSLTAIASDATPNTTTSAGVTVTVNNISTCGDKNPPSQPTGLTATAVSTSPQINLAWNASVDDHGVAGYKVYRNNTQVATVLAGSCSGTPLTCSYGDSGLSPSTTYSYYVIAYDTATPTANNSIPSATVSAKTQAIATTATVQGVISDGSTGKALTWLNDGAYATVGPQATSSGVIETSQANSIGYYILTGIETRHKHSYKYHANNYKSAAYYLQYPAGINIKNVSLSH